MQYTIYNNSTGQILRIVSCPQSMINAQLITSDESYIDGPADDRIEYIKGSEVTLKTQPNYQINKENFMADGEDEIIISGLPIPSKVFVNCNDSYSVDDGSFEFSTDVPGEYTLIISTAQHLDATFTVTAEAI